MKTYTVGEYTYTEKEIVDEYKHAMKMAAKARKADKYVAEKWTDERLARRHLGKSFEQLENGQELADMIMKVGKTLVEKKK